MSSTPDTQSATQLSAPGRRNVVWSALDYGSVPLGMLIATPILIRNLGLAQYGVLVLVTALVGFSAVFNFGFGDTSLKYVSQHLALNNQKRVVEIIRTIGLLVLASGVAIGIIFAASSPAIVVVFKLTDIPNAIETMYVAALIMPLKLTESVYVATIRGCQRYDVAGMITVSTKLASIALMSGLAILGYDLPVLLLAMAGTVVISIVLLFGFCCRQLGNVLPKFFRGVFDEIKGFSIWSWMQGIAGLIYANMDRFILTMVLGPTALGIYGVCIQLAQNIHYGLSATSHSLFPRISTLNSTTQFQSNDASSALRLTYLTVSRSVSVVAVTVGLLLAVFSYEILEVWVGTEIAQKGHLLLSLLSISFSWFAANSIVTYYTLNGLGRARTQAGVSVVSAAIMSISAIIFIPFFGLVGAAIARFPDALFRVGVRIHVARSIVGNISTWTSIDFLRISMLVGIPSYFVKDWLVRWNHHENMLRNPTSVFILVIFAILLSAAAYYIESWFFGNRKISSENEQEGVEN